MKFSLRSTCGAIAALLLLTLSGCNGVNKTIKTLPYPDTRKGDVVEDYHGTSVADPYRWLEDDNSEQTAQWVVAQNEVTYNYLSQIPYRDKVRQRLSELRDYPKEGLPEKHGNYYFVFKNDGLQNQSTLYRMSALDGEAEVMIDPNKLSDGGTVALSSVSFSKDGKYIAYALSASGSDWVEIKVMDAETKTELPDHIKWAKFSRAEWSADSKGFYYSRYDEPVSGTEFSGTNENQKVCYHILGTTQANDRLIHTDPKNPLRYFQAEESKDGKYLFVYVSQGTHGTEVIYRKAAEANAPLKTLFAGFKSVYNVVFSSDDRAWVQTNEGAKNYRLVEIDLAKGAKSAKVVIPETEHKLQGVSAVGGYLIASYLENASDAIYQYDMEGALVRKVELPVAGSVMGFSGEEQDKECFYSLESYISPAIINRYTLADGVSQRHYEPQLKFNPDAFVTQQIFFASKDGTQVPMFVVHRKDIKLDGGNPLYLYGYGGFNISITQAFNPNTIMFLEQGGVYVSVNLRGGGEYGERWHEAGMLERKQNVFDDFIGAAEYLIEKGYTSKEKLAIMGGSNGGLLVGACMTQRPDLFAVALPAVGVMDMLRFHRFTVGWGWVVEYGSADVAEQFGFLYKYSPLHNIKEGVCYPATMVTTGDHDDRVVPAHSFKFAATLQAAQGCDRPALIRIDTDAGHGAGKPTSKRLDEAADSYSFLFWNTNTKVKF